MKRTLAILCLCFFAGPVFSQRLKKMEFHNQSIPDILMVLAEAAGRSIIPDETVTGNASFFFSESEFEDALALFLATYKFNYTKKDGVYYVSRIATSYDAETNLVTLKADDTELHYLIRALSRAIGKTILFDSLPNAMLTVNIENATPEKALEVLAKRFPEYMVEQDPTFFYLKRIPPTQTSQGGKQTPPPSPVVRNGDRYSLALEKGRFLEALAQLFASAGKEYSLLTKTDALLENLYFSDRDFAGMLRLILEQGNADYVEKDGIYYILELQRRDVVKKLKKTTPVELRYIQAQELPNLLPSELASGNILKIDKNTNTVYLTGTDEEVGPIMTFIDLIDIPLEGKRYERFDIKYLKAKDILGVIPQKLLPITPITIPDTNSFVILGNDENIEALGKFIETIDQKKESYPVRLRYIKTEDLLKNLPPSVSKDEVIDSGTPNLLFFVGSEAKRQVFLRELDLMDRPKPQIRYDLLVIQYSRSNGLKSTPSFSVDSDPDDDSKSFAFVGSLSSLLSLDFDVVSEFGYQFAAKLSMEFGENSAKVFADTTLNGIHGQELKFQNTETVRYREPETDDDGNVTYTGVSREISSGLIISISGWISGDNMITMTVNATVSKMDESDTSSTITSVLPKTSERVVTTQVRTPSGKPIVVSGLMQESVDTNIKKLPFLGDIPLIGRLFRVHDDKHEQSEIVIYIVPNLTRGEDGEAETSSERMERYYRSFVADRSR